VNAIAFALRYRVAFILVAALLLAAAFVPGFISPVTLGLGLDRAAAMGLVAVGLTVLLIAGQIDLSAGAIFAVAGIIAVALQPLIGIAAAAAAGVLTGAAAGAFNGLLVVRFGINSLVATLASMLIFRSIAHWLTDSQPVSGIDIMFSLLIGQTYFQVFTLRSALFLVAVLALHVWLNHSVNGRNLFAVGSNPAAAEASGIRSARVFFWSFVFAGTLASLAGVLQSVSMNTGSPVFGSELTVAAIAAVVVGGTRLEGGRGSALGTLGGILTIAVLTTALEFQSVPAYIQQIILGLILILLVVLDRTVRTRPGSGAHDPSAEAAQI
jgi:ribose transport system permease protein